MLEGSCQCGNVRYRVNGDPVRKYICHCSECRKQSGSAFGISVIVKSADFELVSGNPTTWSRKATKRGKLDCAFCPQCGSRLWHGNLDEEDFVSVKGGSLDSKIDVSGFPHIWVSSKMPGIEIPSGVDNHEQEPD